MGTDISLYEIKEILVQGRIDPENCRWMYYVGDSRYVYHAEVGKNGMPKDITRKLKKRGYRFGDVVLLIVDV